MEEARSSIRAFCAGIGLPLFPSSVHRTIAIDRSRMAPTTRSASATGLLLSGTAASAGPPNQQPSSFPLLSLPRDVLALVIAMAGKDKAPWRLACAQLRDMVDSAVTALIVRKCERQWGIVFTSQLIMRLPQLTRVYMGLGGRYIADLTPLAVCTNLHTLNCSYTAVSSLAPLASCTALHALFCCDTAVSSLEPLSACASLYTLDCCGTAVSSLAPLASCTSLHTLYCYGTAVSSLAPLASCTALKWLKCSSSLSTDFDFMKKAKIDSRYYGCHDICFPSDRN